jgi:hypothetical protein
VVPGVVLGCCYVVRTGPGQRREGRCRAMCEDGGSGGPGEPGGGNEWSTGPGCRVDRIPNVRSRGRGRVRVDEISERTSHGCVVLSDPNPLVPRNSTRRWGPGTLGQEEAVLFYLSVAVQPSSFRSFIAGVLLCSPSMKTKTTPRG